jgi:hypothetical protein
MKIEQSNQSEIFCESERTPIECLQLLKGVYGDLMTSIRVLEWQERLMEGRENVKTIMIVFFNITGVIMIE